MANWYHTSFETSNKDIINLIENGSVEFCYYADKEWGRCELRYGMATLDMDAIEKVAKEQGASFKIVAVDPLICITHVWEFKDGKEIRAERIEENPYDIMFVQ